MAAGGGQLVCTFFTGYILACCGMVGTRGMEIALVGGTSVWISASCFYYRHYIARLHGHEDTEAFWEFKTGGADGSVLLWIDVLLTALHLNIPIRWKFLVPVQFLSVLAYSLPAIFVGTPDPARLPMNIIGLGLLAAFASSGKRALEVKERLLFLSLLKEKTLRFEAEHQLSQFEAQGRPAQDGESRVGSENRARAPSTAGTWRAFELDDGNLSLDLLYDLGRREQWLASGSDVRLLPEEVLGEGGFGIVIRGLYCGTQVAVKACKRHLGRDAGGSTLAELCTELRVLRRLRHPRIVSMYGAVLNPEPNVGIKLCLVLELIDGVSLGQFVPSQGGRSDAVRSHLLLDIASALSYLHSRSPPVVHGDLKDGNVFVERHASGSCHAKLLDFGLSRFRTSGAKPMGGTLRWMAPELLRGHVPPDTAVDMFSFGRVVYFVSTGMLPFAEKRGRELHRAVRRLSEPSWPLSREQDLVSFCRPITEKCIQRATALRPSAHDVLDSLRVMVASAGDNSSSPGTSGSSPCDGVLAEEFQGFDLPVGAQASISSGGKLAVVPEGELVTDTPQERAAVARPRDDALLAPDPAPAPEQLKYGSCLQTPRNTQTLMAAFMTMQWNHPVPPGSCCSWHAGVEELRRVYEELRPRPCSHRSWQVHGQCKGCQLVFVGTDMPTECEFCGEECAEAEEPDEDLQSI